MNHVFLTDEEVATLGALALKALTDMNAQVALVGSEPIPSLARDDLQKDMTLMARIAGKLDNPLFGVWASATACKSMSMLDLRNKQQALRNHEALYKDLALTIGNEVFSRFNELRKQRDCAICDDTSGKCEHADMTLDEYIVAYDQRVALGVAA